MAAKIVDITTRTTVFGRVIDAMVLHPLDSPMDFVALGMTLHTQRVPVSRELFNGWTIARLGDDEVQLAKVTVQPNVVNPVTGKRPYPFAKAFVVLAEVGCIVISDADDIRSALADALETIYRSM